MRACPTPTQLGGKLRPLLEDAVAAATDADFLTIAYDVVADAADALGVRPLHELIGPDDEQMAAALVAHHLRGKPSPEELRRRARELRDQAALTDVHGIRAAALAIARDEEGLWLRVCHAARSRAWAALGGLDTRHTTHESKEFMRGLPFDLHFPVGGVDVHLYGGVLFVNCGSVGKPKDGDPRGAFAVLTPNVDSVSIERIEYDVDTVAGEVREAGLPGEFADKLLVAA